MRDKIAATICLTLVLGAAGCEVKKSPKLESQEIGRDWKGGMEKIRRGEGYAFLRARVDRGGGITQMWERDPGARSRPHALHEGPQRTTAKPSTQCGKPYLTRRTP